VLIISVFLLAVGTKALRRTASAATRAKSVKRTASAAKKQKLTPYERKLLLQVVYRGSKSWVNGTLLKPVSRMHEAHIKSILISINDRRLQPKWQNSRTLERVRARLLRELDRRHGRN